MILTEKQTPRCEEQGIIDVLLVLALVDVVEAKDGRQDNVIAAAE